MPTRKALPAGELPTESQLTGWRKTADENVIAPLADVVRGLLGMDAGDGKTNANALGHLLPFAAGIGNLPKGLMEVLKREGMVALDEPMVNALGKPVSEMLGTAFKTPAKSGLPQRLTVANWNAPEGAIEMRGATKAAADTKFNVKPSELDDLINGGALDLKQPPSADVGRVQSKLKKLLGPRADSTPTRARELSLKFGQGQAGEMSDEDFLRTVRIPDASRK